MNSKVLLVDDDENILAGYIRRLRKNFEVYTAGSGKEGLKILSSQGPFEVIISDLRMPVMDGFEFLSRANEIDPSAICIMLTGHAELQTSLKAFNKGYIFRFLTKPCKTDLLKETIHEAVDEYIKKSEILNEKPDSDKKDNFKRVLILDDDQETLPIASSALSKKNEMEVLTAESNDIALKILSIIKINLLIADGSLALTDDYKTIKKIHYKYPDLNIALTVWDKSENLKNRLKKYGINKFYQKPLDFNSLPDLIMDEFYSGPKGIIDGISISTFLQMIEMEEKTCTLTINADEKNGQMFFKKGSLLDAETGELKGEKAAYTIINWEKAAIEIENYCTKSVKIISQPLMSILMEAAKIQDHEEINISETDCSD